MISLSKIPIGHTRVKNLLKITISITMFIILMVSKIMLLIV